MRNKLTAKFAKVITTINLSDIFLAGILFLLLFSVFSCNSDNGEPANPIYKDPSLEDFSQNPALLERIKSGPHGYLRFINILFCQEVCRRFEGFMIATPSFNLHGDSHIEQYAVTDLGRGLTDYDDSSTGPAVIDLMRFGVSLHLACRENEWEDHSDSLFNEFIRGYREALENPAIEAPEPAVARRFRAAFVIDKKRYS